MAACQSSKMHVICESVLNITALLENTLSLTQITEVTTEKMNWNSWVAQRRFVCHTASIGIHAQALWTGLPLFDVSGLTQRSNLARLARGRPTFLNSTPQFLRSNLIRVRIHSMRLSANSCKERYFGWKENKTKLNKCYKQNCTRRRVHINKSITR